MFFVVVRESFPDLGENFFLQRTDYSVTRDKKIRTRLFLLENSYSQEEILAERIVSNTDNRTIRSRNVNGEAEALFSIQLKSIKVKTVGTACVGKIRIKR